MNKIDLPNIISRIDEFAKERDWDQFHSVKNLAMAMSVESSELMEIFQWSTEEQSNNVKNDQKTKQKLEEEIADVFIYLCRILDKAEIKLEEVVLKKLEKNAAKYPVSCSKGSALKYTELEK